MSIKIVYICSQLFTHRAHFSNVDETITAYQILDHSPNNETTHFNISGGLNDNFVLVNPIAPSNQSRFELFVYGGPIGSDIDRNNTVTVGEFTNRSQLIHSYVYFI